MIMINAIKGLAAILLLAAMLAVCLVLTLNARLRARLATS